MSILDTVTAATLDQIKKMQASTDLAKSTAGLTLEQYDLQQPAQNLYPVLCPIRNETPREQRVGSATHWKAVTALTRTGGMFVAAGARNPNEVGFTQVDKMAAFYTFGRDNSVTWEAEIGAAGYDDLRARITLATLQDVMIEEEDAIIGASNSLALGTPATPVLAASGTGGTLPALTYDVACVALPHLGYRGISGLTLPTAHSQKSVVATQAITLGQNLTMTVVPVVGTMAYAWFVGGAGAARLEKITTINSATFTAPLLGTGALLSGVTADTSTDSLSFDGMLPQLFQGGYVVTQPTGTAGTGTPLTSDSAGGINEIDVDLKYFWDFLRVGPSEILMNSQEALNINRKIVAASGAPVFQFIEQSDGAGGRTITGGSRVSLYANKFVQGDNMVVKLRVHPYVAPGTMIYRLTALPAHFPNPQIKAPWVMGLVRDYYQEQYARTARRYDMGVYVRGALEGYLPGFQGIRTNIGNG